MPMHGLHQLSPGGPSRDGRTICNARYAPLPGDRPVRRERGHGERTESELPLSSLETLETTVQRYRPS